MTAAGYPDWQKGVQLADNPLVLLAVADVIDADHDLGNVRRWASYYIQASYLSTPAASATNYAVIIIRFFSDAALTMFTGEELIELNRTGNQLMVRGPMRGGYLVVSTVLPGVAGQTLNLAVAGSNRPVERLGVHARDAADRAPEATSIVALAAAAKVTLFVPSFYGPGHVDVEAKAQPCSVSIFVGSLTPAVRTFALLANTEDFREMTLPLRPLRIELTNTGAAPGDYVVTVVARDN